MDDAFSLSEHFSEEGPSFPYVEIHSSPTNMYLEPNRDLLNSFLYPLNHPKRNYQYVISQECLRKNTLVCLPTGSGKTFIAAVVIINFYRWFPKGIIIFVAPTRTLVQQQVDACNSFSIINQNDIGLLIGGIKLKEHTSIWRSRRVIYATSQVINNALEKSSLDPTKVCLVVLDEAHHASKNHPYALFIKNIAERNANFRVVGLSATPGKDFDTIQNIIYQIMASKVIYMDSTDKDIAKYQHKTSIEVIVVRQGGDNVAFLELLHQCMYFIAIPLMKAEVFPHIEPKRITRGRVWVAMNQYKKNLSL